MRRPEWHCPRLLWCSKYSVHAAAASRFFIAEKATAGASGAFYILVSWSVLKEPNVSFFLCCQAWIPGTGCLLHWFPSNNIQDPLTIKITNSQNLSERPLSHRASQTQPPGRIQRNTKRKVMLYSLVFFPRLTKSVPSSCHTSVSQWFFQHSARLSVGTRGDMFLADSFFFPKQYLIPMFIIFLN